MAITIRTGSIPTKGTNALNADNIIIEMDDRLYLKEPNKDPLVLLSKKFGSSTVHNPEFKWQESERTPELDRVDNSGGYTAGATTVAVDNGPYFPINSLCRVQRTGEVMKVTAVSTNDLTVGRSFGGTAAAALEDNDQLSILGPNATEGASAEVARGVISVTKNNFTEIIRDGMEVTGTLAATDLYTGDELNKLHMERGIEHAVSQEMKFLYGEKVETASGARAVRGMGGMHELITTNVTAMGGSLTLVNIFTAAEVDFRYGGQTKMLFGGAPVISNISLVAKDHLETVPKADAFGINVKRIITPHGNYLVTKHHLMSGDTYKKEALIIDPENVGYVTLSGRGTKLRTNIQANDADTREDEFLTEAGIKRRLEVTHAKWTNASA